MKVNFKVKMKVTIAFLVEIYFRNVLHFFEKKYTLYIVLLYSFNKQRVYRYIQ